MAMTDGSDGEDRRATRLLDTAGLWETNKSHFQKLTSAMLPEPHANSEDRAQDGSGLLRGECCTSVLAEAGVETTSNSIGAAGFCEVLQISGQKEVATFSDVLQELLEAHSLKETSCLRAGRTSACAGTNIELPSVAGEVKKTSQ